MEPVYYLDGDGSVLCEDCAEVAKEDFVHNFRPKSGPHTNTSSVRCDECSLEIPVEEDDHDANW